MKLKHMPPTVDLDLAAQWLIQGSIAADENETNLPWKAQHGHIALCYNGNIKPKRKVPAAMLRFDATVTALPLPLTGTCPEQKLNETGHHHLPRYKQLLAYLAKTSSSLILAADHLGSKRLETFRSELFIIGHAYRRQLQHFCAPRRVFTFSQHHSMARNATKPPRSKHYGR